MSADTVTVHQVTCDHCGHTAHIGTRPSALDWALADLGWKGDTTKLCPTCADAGEDRMVASGYRITTTEETAVNHDEPQPPIPADDQAHAYVVVERTHSPHADRPEWDRPAIVIPAHEASDLAYWRGRPDHALIPIGPDGDTGTRAVVEPDGAAEKLAAIRALATEWVGDTPDALSTARGRRRIEDGRALLALLAGESVSDGE